MVIRWLQAIANSWRRNRDRGFPTICQRNLHVFTGISILSGEHKRFWWPKLHILAAYMQGLLTNKNSLLGHQAKPGGAKLRVNKKTNFCSVWPPNHFQPHETTRFSPWASIIKAKCWVLFILISKFGVVTRCSPRCLHFLWPKVAKLRCGELESPVYDRFRYRYRGWQFMVQLGDQ
jgi:hypothetical protein